MRSTAMIALACLSSLEGMQRHEPLSIDPSVFRREQHHRPLVVASRSDPMSAAELARLSQRRARQRASGTR